MVRGEKRALWVPVHVLEQNWFHLHCSEWNSSECSNKHQSRSPPHLPCSSLVRTLAGTHSSPQQIFEWQTLWPKHQQETTVSVSGARYDFFADTELLEASFSSQLQYCWCGYTQIFRLPRPTSRPTEAVPSQLTPNLVPSLLGSVALISHAVLQVLNFPPTPWKLLAHPSAATPRNQGHATSPHSNQAI